MDATETFQSIEKKLNALRDLVLGGKVRMADSAEHLKRVDKDLDVLLDGLKLSGFDRENLDFRVYGKMPF